MKPVALPTRSIPSLRASGDRRQFAIGISPRVQYTLVVARHDANELRLGRRPGLQNRRGQLAVRIPGVTLDEIENERLVIRFDERLEIDHLSIAPLREIAGQISDERDTAAHPGGEVTASPTQH